MEYGHWTKKWKKSWKYYSDHLHIRKRMLAKGCRPLWVFANSFVLGVSGRVWESKESQKAMLPTVAYELVDNFIRLFDCLLRCSAYLCQWTIASNYLCIAMKHCKNFKVSVTNSISNLVTHGCRPRQRTVIHYFVLRSGRNKENKVQVTAHLTIILQLKSFQRQRVK